MRVWGAGASSLHLLVKPRAELEHERLRVEPGALLHVFDAVGDRVAVDALPLACIVPERVPQLDGLRVAALEGRAVEKALEHG